MTDKQRTRRKPATGIRRSPVSISTTTTTGSTSIDQSTPHAPSQDRPLFLSRVAAGFPSPADSHVEKRLDLNEFLIRHDAATFFVRVKGDSMVDAGILDNDVLVVDRSLAPRQGCIVVAVVDGEFTVKTLGCDKDGQMCLVPANRKHSVITIKDGMNVEIWGVVTGSIRKYK